MGQYSQWLQYREIDQQLRESLELLEQQWHTLQEQAAQLEDASSCTDNPILQAIAMQQSAEALLEDTAPSLALPQLSPASLESKEQASKSVSSALFAWSHLPNLDPQKVPLSAKAHNTSTTEEIVQQPPLSHPDINLLPPDMAAFIDTHKPGQPPRWLRHATLVAQPDNTPELTPPAPDERTDASIRRWLQRWGKQVPNNSPSKPQSPRSQEVYKHE